MTDYAESRLAVVKYQTAIAGPGHVMLAGDSNLELYGGPRESCGRVVVNAGVSGATAAIYQAFSSRLVSLAPAHATVLTIGTNDLLRKNRPLAEDSIERFTAATTAIVASLRARSEHLVVTAIPPIGDHQVSAVDPMAVERYSGILEAACRGPRCTFMDPFAPERTGIFGVAREGATEGLHLVRYESAYAGLLRDLCRLPRD